MSEPTEVDRDRRAYRLLGGGTEPDPRFTLANERTFLAWIRTSLALLAGGVGVEAFAQDVFPPGWRKVIAIVLIVLAILMSGSAWYRWLRVERAMRHRKPLPLSGLSIALAAGVAAVSAVILVVFLVRGS